MPPRAGTERVNRARRAARHNCGRSAPGRAGGAPAPGQRLAATSSTQVTPNRSVSIP